MTNEKVPDRLYVQLTPLGHVSYERDPRDVHDNGKPVYVYVPESRVKEEREAAFKDVIKIIDEAGEEWGIQARDRKSKTYSAYVIAALDLKGRIEAAATENRKEEG